MLFCVLSIHFPSAFPVQSTKTFHFFVVQAADTLDLILINCRLLETWTFYKSSHNSGWYRILRQRLRKKEGCLESKLYLLTMAHMVFIGNRTCFLRTPDARIHCPFFRYWLLDRCRGSTHLGPNGHSADRYLYSSHHSIDCPAAEVSHEGFPWTVLQYGWWRLRWLP